MNIPSEKSCSLKRCVADQAYAVVKDDKIYRLTFSKSLAKHITKVAGDGFQVKSVRFTTGKKLKDGEESSTGMYAIVSKRNDWTLRISLNRELAYYLVDESRYVAECFLNQIEGEE